MSPNKLAKVRLAKIIYCLIWTPEYSINMFGRVLAGKIKGNAKAIIRDGKVVISGLESYKQVKALRKACNSLGYESRYSVFSF